MRSRKILNKAYVEIHGAMDNQLEQLQSCHTSTIQHFPNDSVSFLRVTVTSSSEATQNTES
jgi:hypothetical protein